MLVECVYTTICSHKRQIVNEMKKFISEHKCCNNNINNKRCWYCNMFQTTITIMIENDNNLYIGKFSKILFETPDAIPDPKNKKMLIYHSFHTFKQNKFDNKIHFKVVINSSM